MKTFEIQQTETYENNQDNSKTNVTCLRCGKDVKNIRYEVECIDGGAYALATKYEADINDSGYMGFYAIGSDCKKHIPSEFIHKR